MLILKRSCVKCQELIYLTHSHVLATQKNNPKRWINWGRQWSNLKLPPPCGLKVIKKSSDTLKNTEDIDHNQRDAQPKHHQEFQRLDSSQHHWLICHLLIPGLQACLTSTSLRSYRTWPTGQSLETCIGRSLCSASSRSRFWPCSWWLRSFGTFWFWWPFWESELSTVSLTTWWPRWPSRMWWWPGWWCRWALFGNFTAAGGSSEKRFAKFGFLAMFCAARPASGTWLPSHSIAIGPSRVTLSTRSRHEKGSPMWWSDSRGCSRPSYPCRRSSAGERHIPRRIWRAKWARNRHIQCSPPSARFICPSASCCSCTGRSTRLPSFASDLARPTPSCQWRRLPR